MFKSNTIYYTVDSSEICVSIVLELQNGFIAKKTSLCFCPTFT